MASPSPLPVDQDEGPPPLRCPFVKGAHARPVGFGGALPQWAAGPGPHAGTGAPSRQRGSGRCRGPRNRRCAGSAVRART
ncbi:putative protein OS=Streptomyces griseomycini OX=66895 GN=FHS37_003222 PE=4 SV=1 [Streptomyces griseomycini]|uniref:Uncharacterized protein n=1 Tax=Streptomyces griseomycini TaxID=66895 RepID=A0A7W7PR32_9ACTN|nr:hypothetical protein [Streptomyces griseomycini]